ncbi:MAG: tRNA uridine-5-carboxymethylaminomethyl(34) synthesis GTPase MnmE [Balneolales bacterium]
MIIQKEPIAAIATPVGEGGISVIRVSGEGCFDLVQKTFRGKKLSDQSSHTVHYGYIMQGERRIDDVLATVFRSPKSYTGEDTVEISGHGGVLVTQAVLEAMLSAGARHATPGEFTHRAFLNGKMELSQAEAVADLIHARSTKAIDAARQQLEGSLGEYVKQFRQQIIDATALVELELDFIEEDVEFASRDKLSALLSELDTEINKLLDTYESGRIVKHGVRTVFAGLPNAGKSTLLNTLMGKERAIVSATAGTTRDVIDADWSYDGLLFKLTDTAGLRETVDFIEAEGVRRSQKAMEEADLIVYLKDISDPFSDEEAGQVRKLREKLQGKGFICAGAKCDLLQNGNPKGDVFDVLISAETGHGIEELKRMMRELVKRSKAIDTSGLLVTSSRHRDALLKTQHHIHEARNALEGGITGDFLSIDLRAALRELGSITGEITTEDLLDSIFSRFCIGK